MLFSNNRRKMQFMRYLYQILSQKATSAPFRLKLDQRMFIARFFSRMASSISFTIRCTSAEEFRGKSTDEVVRLSWRKAFSNLDTNLETEVRVNSLILSSSHSMPLGRGNRIYVTLDYWLHFESKSWSLTISTDHLQRQFIRLPI